MRSLLMTLLLIVVAVAIYVSTIGGETGMQRNVIDNGGRINGTIQSINP